MKKIISIFMCVLLLVSMAACKSGPKLAKDLVAASSELEDAGNYKMKGNIVMTMAFDVMGMSLDIPVNVDIDVDVYGDSSHGLVDMTSTMLDEEMKESYEIYTAGGDAYMQYGDTWMKTSSDSDAIDFVAIGEKFRNSDVFSDANMSFDKSSDTYVVTMSAGVLFGDDASSVVFDDAFIGSLSNTTDADMIAAMIDAFAQSDVTYTFDSEYRLLSVVADDLSYVADGTDEATGMSTTTSISMSFEFNFVDYGTITADDVAVPDDVSSEAVVPEEVTVADGADE